MGESPFWAKGERPMAQTWSAEAITRLRELWSDLRLSCAEIARRLGVSKNAVVGKAHRLKLPARPSPIQKKGAQEVKSARAGDLRPTSSSGQIHARPQAMPQSSALATPEHSERLLVSPLRGYKSCRWPIGEPGTEGFRFCTAECEPRKSYCPEHCRIAYVALRRVEEGS
jgi:GcrA cell cycle regulator